MYVLNPGIRLGPVFAMLLLPLICGGCDDDANLCDDACPSGYVCSGGRCLLSCSSGLTECTDVCANIQTDSDHCGACARACAGGQVCKAGTCVANCPKDFTDCSGTCVNLRSDTKNCGTCARACAASEVCASGKCDSSCGSGQTSCKGSCIDTKTSNSNCGACGTTWLPARHVRAARASALQARPIAPAHAPGS